MGPWAPWAPNSRQWPNNTCACTPNGF